MPVIGAGPAGLAFSEIAALRGHHVELFEASDQIGGQFNLAKQIPGKEEFHETIRYFSTMLKKNGVKVHLNKKVQPIDLKEKNMMMLLYRREYIQGLLIFLVLMKR